MSSEQTDNNNNNNNQDVNVGLSLSSELQEEEKKMKSSSETNNNNNNNKETSSAKPVTTTTTTTISDEEMRKLLQPDPTDDDIIEIIKTTYIENEKEDNYKIIKRLDSYDDCNYQIEINNKLYLLKVHNGVESQDFLRIYQKSNNVYYKKGYAGSCIHFQNAIMETLIKHNIPTSIPVIPKKQSSNNTNDTYAPLSIHTLPVFSSEYSPTTLIVRVFHWVPGRPMSSIPLLPLECLAEVGYLLGKVDVALDTSLTPETPFMAIRRIESEKLVLLTNNSESSKLSNNNNNNFGLSSTDLKTTITTIKEQHMQDPSLLMAGKRYHQWDQKNTLDLLKFTKYIKDEKRKAMVESVISSFQSDIIDSEVHFRTGINHNDFNDANIMVDNDLNICGVIDFGDSIESWRVLDVAIAMAYGMLSTYGKANRSISAAAAVLRGYNSVYPLTEEEQKHLVLLIACRLSCSVTLGAFSYEQNPANQYLLLHAEPAWRALELIWGYDEHKRQSMKAAFNRVFKQACLYTDSRERPIVCYDLVMPDPTVADLLQPIRVRSIFDMDDPKPNKKRRFSVTNGDGSPTITFVTGNAKKLEEVKRILGMDSSTQPETPFKLTNMKIDLPELQGEALNIAREKCITAAEEIGNAVIVEDTSLCFNALNGMPGVFIKWFLDSCGHEGLNRMIADYDDKSAYAQTVVAFSPGPGEEPVLFDGRTIGKIVMPRGKLDFGWDPIFQPNEGGGKTYAEMTKEEKDAISHRSRAFAQAREYLRKFQADILRSIKKNSEQAC